MTKTTVGSDDPQTTHEDALVRAPLKKKPLRDLLQEELKRGIELQRRTPPGNGMSGLMLSGRLNLADRSEVDAWAAGVNDLLRDDPIRLAEFEAKNPRPAGFSVMRAPAEDSTYVKLDDRIKNLDRIIRDVEE